MDYHQPVLLDASVEGLKIKPDGVYVDVTFGGGGHSREILARLDKGKLIAFDQDKDALDNLPDDSRLIFVQHNFRFLQNFLKYHQINAIDGILADLGVSSHHFDTPERGFSFRFNGTLDMRMNNHSGFSARDLLNTYNMDQLAKIFREYGEIQNAGSLARSIISFREANPLNEIRDLLEAISTCLPKRVENQYLAKLFQAIRIEVNHEIQNLKELILQANECLSPGGRMVVISYHSLEDRLVKNFMRTGNFEGKVDKDLYGNLIRPLNPINAKVIVPDEDEIIVNSRARSAKLRIAEKNK